MAPSVNEAQQMADELLWVAAQNNVPQVVEDLIQRHKANKNQVSPSGQTRLHQAAQNEQHALEERRETATQKLIQKGANTKHLSTIGGFSVDELGANPRRKLIKNQPGGLPQSEPGGGEVSMVGDALDEPDVEEEPEEEKRLPSRVNSNSDMRPEVDGSTLSEELVPVMYDYLELTELLENYNGDLGQVLRSYKQLFEIWAAKKLRRKFESCGLEEHDFLHDLEQDQNQRHSNSAATWIQFKI
eukprot:s822_g35.t1